MAHRRTNQRTEEGSTQSSIKYHVPGLADSGGCTPHPTAITEDPMLVRIHRFSISLSIQSMYPLLLSNGPIKAIYKIQDTRYKKLYLTSVDMII